VNDYSIRLQIHSEPYEVAAMATETRDQSASLAEVSRSFFTDPVRFTTVGERGHKQFSSPPGCVWNLSYLSTNW
jgi:hypothetical protein